MSALSEAILLLKKLGQLRVRQTLLEKDVGSRNSCQAIGRNTLTLIEKKGKKEEEGERERQRGRGRDKL